MRGKRILLRFFFLNLRNIPVYAGKTLVTRGANYGSREHPRVCGENAGSMMAQESVGGTSPRMRGKRQPGLLLLPKPGNIPAYAGKTLTFTALVAPIKEHPRVCGENLVKKYYS